MRPVNRNLPAVNTYPPDFNSLPDKQKGYSQFLHDMLFEPETEQCKKWATELDKVYSFDDDETQPAKKAKVDSVNWETYQELKDKFASVKLAYEKRPNPANPDNLREKTGMAVLYKKLNDLALRKPVIVQNREDKLPKTYGQSRRQLIANIGQYCSYCELPLAASLAVEHMLPKSYFPLVALAWDNFLLACPLCNSYKNDKPTRATGIRFAVGLNPYDPLKAPTAPQEDLIQAGALGTYLWPSDPAYTAFQNFYQFAMRKRIYDKAGTLRTDEIVPNANLENWIKFGLIEYFSDKGHAITVGVKDMLHSFSPADSVQIRADLNGGTINPTLLAELRNHRLVLDPVPTTPTLGKVKLASDGTNQNYVITEKRGFYVDLSGDSRRTIDVPISEYDAGDTPNPLNKPVPLKPLKLNKQDQATFRMQLQAGLLPTQLETVFAQDAYKVNAMEDSISVTISGRTDFFVEIVKTYLLPKAGDPLMIYRQTKFQAELHLQAVFGPKSLQANNVIDELNLNNVNAAVRGNKLTDRRMIKRTHTWFIAVESFQRLAQALNNGISEGPLLTAIAETAKATGFWSVWRTVFRQGLSSLPQARQDTLMSFLNNNNFPGTR